MSRMAGVWIDRERAVIVVLADERTEVTRVASGVRGRVRLSGGSRSKTPYGPQDVADERSRGRKRSQEFARFFERVIDRIQDVERIIVFGPGEAKHELAKALVRSKRLAGKLVGIEPADKMTEPQIVARVRSFYGRRVKRFTVPVGPLRRGPVAGGE